MPKIDSMQIGVLGPLIVDGAVTLRPRTRTVLAALAVRRDELVAPDELADAVWREAPPQSWSKQVQICVWDLRKAIGAEAIETVSGSYRLATSRAALDSVQFEALVESARAHASTGQAELAATTFANALAMWRGRPFPDVEGWMPARQETARLDELRRSAEEDVIEARLASGEHRAVVSLAEARAMEEPMRERRWALLALAQYRCGNQADALRSLRRARRSLVEELGIDPGLELVALETAILDQDPALVVDDPIASTGRCPYKGLRPFESTDHELFFGRDADVTACLTRLESVRLLVLAGPSGCGKSSLVHAGIVPVLRDRQFAVASIAPGADPDAALSAALAAAPGRPILVVDQIEELFAGQHREGMARDLCRRLAAYAIHGAPVIVTVRADHLGSLAAEPDLSRLVELGLYVVGPMTERSLRTTIEAPAAAAGLRLEPGLVDLLVRDVQDEPGALPMLSHALAETWARRDGRVLTVAAYRDTGEIRGAVARSSEQLYASLPPDQQLKLRSLLLRLVGPTDAGDHVRAHLDVRTLDDDPDRTRLLELLVRARLVTQDETTVQLAHEAVGRAWPRLRSWLDDDAVGQRSMRHLSVRAGEWDASGRPDSELYRGARLETALEWRDGSAPDLTAIEAGFLEASERAAESDRRAVEVRARDQAAQNRRLRAALVGIAALLLLALVGGVVAWNQRERAVDGQRDAALSALIGNASQLRASRRDLAALLAVEAHRLDPGPASESALFGTFTASPGARRTRTTDIALTAVAGTATYLADGRTVVLGKPDGGIRLLDVDTGEGRDLPGLSATPGWSVVALSGDGRYLVAAWRPLFEPETGTLTVWDLQRGTRRFDAVDVPFRIGGLAISADGAIIAVSGGAAGRVMLLDGTTGSLRAELPPLPRPPEAGNVVVTTPVAFAPDGRLAVGSQAGPVRFFDATTATEQARFDAGLLIPEGSLQFIDGGATVVALGSNGIQAFDVATGRARWATPTTAPCNSLGLVEHLGLAICGDYSGSVRTIDLATGAKLGRRFDSQHGDVCAIAVSPDGSRLAEVAGCQRTGATVVEWRLDGGGPVSRPVEHVASADRWVEQFGFEGTDALVAGFASSADDAPRVHVVDITDGHIVATLDAGIYGVVPTTDPDIAVVVYDDDQHPVRVGRYDTRRRTPAGPEIDVGSEIRQFFVHGDVAYVLEGDTPDRTGGVRSFDLLTGRAGWSLEPDLDVQIASMAIDDEAVYVSSYDVSDATNEAIIRRYDRHTGNLLRTSAPGYPTIATGGGHLVASRTDGHIAELDPVELVPTGAPFAGVNGQAASMALDDTATRLVVSGMDTSIRIFDLATRTQLGDAIEAGTCCSTSLRSDGTAAAMVTDTGVTIWDLDPAHWERAACELAGRNLTPAEWTRYIGSLAPYRTTCPDQPTSEG